MAEPGGYRMDSSALLLLPLTHCLTLRNLLNLLGTHFFHLSNGIIMSLLHSIVMKRIKVVITYEAIVFPVVSTCTDVRVGP